MDRGAIAGGDAASRARGVTRQDLGVRTRAFALQIIYMVRALPETSEARILGRQVLRSATSVGSNYRSALRARSKPDFISKLAIAEEEADETCYWLLLLKESGLLAERAAEPLLREADELTAILTASGKTAKSRLN